MPFYVSQLNEEERERRLVKRQGRTQEAAESHHQYMNMNKSQNK